MTQPSASETLKTAQRYVYEGRFDEAIQAVSRLLAAEPHHPDALYMKAVAERYAKRSEAALETLKTLKEVVPDFGRAYQEEGHIFRDNRNTAKALAAYELAVRANPGLIASWKALAALQSGPQAQQAVAQAKRLETLPKELLSVTNLLFEEKLLKAETLCRRFLKSNPKNTEGMRLLSAIAVRFGVLDEAEFLLESALAFEPSNIQIQLDLIEVLRKRQKFADALRAAKALYDSDPQNPVFQSHYAIEALQAGDFESALATFDAILTQLPDDAATLTSKGHALKTIGDQDAAIESYRRAYKANATHADAYHALANLKTYRFTDSEIQAMAQLESAGNITYDGRIQLNFALGKAFEDREDFDTAFSHYERGNRLKKVQCRYDSDQMGEELALQAEVCTKELFAAFEGAGTPEPDPIFIVGLPRAGSTLLEQILASHSQVDGTMELPNILSLSHRLRAGQALQSETGYPRGLKDLTHDQLKAYGEQFLSETRIHRKNAPFFIDKMPNNFRHIGLIHLILPNAKVIDARRDPLSCCFSGFKQLFAEGQEFTYGLTEIGRYYHDYTKLMAHWDTVLPGKVLRVQYEDVVEDLETQVRRLLDFCGLPFEEACLQFHKTKRSVRTASSEQVRQPINTKGLEPWRPFEKHLEPLKAALGDLLV